MWQQLSAKHCTCRCCTFGSLLLQVVTEALDGVLQVDNARLCSLLEHCSTDSAGISAAEVAQRGDVLRELCHKAGEPATT